MDYREVLKRLFGRVEKGTQTELDLDKTKV